MHKKIFSNTAYITMASLIEKIGGFLIIPILTQSLSATEYGDLILGMSYAGIMMLLIYNGLHSALFRWYSMWTENFDKRIYEKYLFIIVNSIAFILVIFLIALNNIYDFSALLKVDFWLFITIVISSIVLIMYNFKSNIWIIEHRAYFNLIFVAVKTLLIVCGIYFFIKIYPYAITRPIIEIIVVSLLSLYFVYEYIFNYPSLRSISFQDIRPLLKESLIYGWGLQISQIAFWIINSSDRIMLANLLNNQQIAYYSILMIGITVIFMIVAFNNSFSVYYNKMVTEKFSMKDINRYIYIYLLYGSILIFIYKIILYFLSDYIIVFLATQEYLIISKYMYLTSDILLFYFCYLLFSRYLHAHKMIQQIIIITFVSAVINIILNYFFIHSYAILGALMASIIAYFCMAVFSFYFMYKNIEFHYIKHLFFLFFSISLINVFIDIFLYKGNVL